MRYKINNVAKLGMLLGLIAITPLCAELTASGNDVNFYSCVTVL